MIEFVQYPRILIFIASFSLCLTSCGDDMILSTEDSITDLDEKIRTSRLSNTYFTNRDINKSDNPYFSLQSELIERMELASSTGDVSFYKMPLSQSLDQIPQDPKNRLTRGKVNLGKLLFHETAFGLDVKLSDTKATFSCASCHHERAGFQAGMMQGIGEGGQGFGIRGESRIKVANAIDEMIDVQPLRTPSTMNLAYQTNLLWNGQFGATAINTGTEDRWLEDTPIASNHLGFEGLETQAIAGIGVHRQLFTRKTIVSNGYKHLFDAVFPEMNEEERYTNVTAGLAIASYERTLLANKSPFQLFLQGYSHVMTSDEIEGANLFFGKAACVNCHSGPALANMEFHAIGLKDFEGTKVLNHDPENAAFKGRMSFTGNPNDEYKFKVPQLYNLMDSPFYGHGASFESIEEIIRYKNQAVPENKAVSDSQLSNEFKPLNLSDEEIYQLTTFIEHSLNDLQLERYLPSNVYSGNCFPNNDPMSKIDLGCN